MSLNDTSLLFIEALKHLDETMKQENTDYYTPPPQSYLSTSTQYSIQPMNLSYTQSNQKWTLEPGGENKNKIVYCYQWKIKQKGKHIGTGTMN